MKIECIGGPLDGREVETPDPPEQYLRIPITRRVGAPLYGAFDCDQVLYHLEHRASVRGGLHLFWHVYVAEGARN